MKLCNECIHTMYLFIYACRLPMYPYNNSKVGLTLEARLHCVSPAHINPAGDRKSLSEFSNRCYFPREESTHHYLKSLLGGSGDGS